MHPCRCDWHHHVLRFTLLDTADALPCICPSVHDVITTRCTGWSQGLVGRRLHVLAAAVQRDITAAHEDLVYTLDWQVSHAHPASAPPLLQMTGETAINQLMSS